MSKRGGGSKRKWSETEPSTMRIPVTLSRPQSGSVSWLKYSTLEAIEIRFLVPLGHFWDNAFLVERRSDCRLRSAPQCQQHRGKQQEATECQPHPSLRQSAGELDANRDRRDVTKCKR